MDWHEGERSELVRLPTGQSLYLIAAGPRRQRKQTPAIVIEHGLGGSRFEWLATIRLVAKFARVYHYERAGYVPSDPPLDESPPTLKNSAANLKLLLETASVDPPFILVGHSLGGKLIRQFLADYSSHVVKGMVIVDSAPLLTPMPTIFPELLGEKSYPEVMGLDVTHTIPEDEFAKVRDEDPANAAIEKLEWELARNDGPGTGGRELYDRLKGRQALGGGRLSVIFGNESMDLRRAYEYALKNGHASPAALEEARQTLEDMETLDLASNRENLELSSNARFVRTEGKLQTHNLHLVDPAFVAREIQWVYEPFEGA